MKTENKEGLYAFKCIECYRVFKTNNPKEKLCPDCVKFRQPRRRKYKKTKKKILTLPEILHIANVYYKTNHKYLHYGDVVVLVDRNVDRCVCCGEIVPEGRHVCPQCEKAVE